MRNLRIHAFSLIELMVVVAIVAMLATAAVPSFNNEMIQSRVASLMPLADSVKTYVLEQHNIGTVFGTTTQVEIDSTTTTKLPKYLTSLVRDEYGCVTINYNTAQLGLNSAQQLALVYCPTNDEANGVVTWNCGYSATSDTSYANYLPDACRQQATQDLTM